MRILVTGCGGFIGSHLLERLLTRPSVVVVGWDPDASRIGHLRGHPQLVYRQAGLGGAETLEALEADMKGCDWVLSLQGVCNPSLYTTQALRTIHANLFAVYPVIELAARLNRRLVHFSTSEVYGRTLASYLGPDAPDYPHLYRFDAATSPLIMGPVQNQRWSYAASKQMIERLIQAHHVEQGLPFAVVRPFNVVGPGQDFLPGIEAEGVPRVLPMFLAAMLRAKPMQLVDGGHARRAFTSVHDLVDAVLAILDQPERALGHFYNIGNPANEVTIRALAIALRRSFVRITGQSRFADHPIEDIASQQLYGAGYEDCDRRIMDITAETARLGWRPVRDLDSLLDEVVAWYWARHGA